MRQGIKIAVLAGLAALATAFPAAAREVADTALTRVFQPAATASAPAPRWVATVERMAAEAPAKPCPVIAKAKHADCGASGWDRRLAKLRLRSPLQQLKAVNRGVNALTYVSDTDNWGQADYWATPREMFERGGDCEDFATAKYFALRQLGFAAADLRIAVVWDKVDREQHAVLLARTSDRIMVLDNKRADLTPAAVLADRYQLLYSLDDGRIRLPLQAEPATISGAVPRSGARIIHGGRTLVMRIEPRRRGALPAPTPAPAPPIEMALAELAVPSGR